MKLPFTIYTQFKKKEENLKINIQLRIHLIYTNQTQFFIHILIEKSIWLIKSIKNVN